MFNLYYLNDILTNGFIISWLDLLGLISLIFGVFTTTNKNPVVSVLFLIGLFSIISVYLVMMDLTFIGLSYLLVYVGAVSILFLFILMLLNIRISELESKNNNYLPLAILCVISFVNILGDVIPGFTTEKLDINSTEKINTVVSNNWDNLLIDVLDINSIGNIIYSSNSIWLIITSLILLLAMVGAIIITLKE